MQKAHDTAAMANRRRLLGLLLVAVFGCALFIFLIRDSQPTYHGKSLSEWVARYTKTKWDAGWRTPDPVQQKPAADAIRHIGTNAIPLLLALIDDPPPGLWRRGGALTDPLPDWIRGHPVVRWARQHHAVVLIPDDARSLSEALGPIAAPAIPDLVQRLSSTNWTGRTDLALHALASIGSEATAAAPCIATHLSDSNERVRYYATNALLRIAPDLLTKAPSAQSQISVH